MTNLHLGSGAIKLPGFINIDKEPSHNPDVCADYLEYLSDIEGASVDNILICHSLEHLKYPSEVVLFFILCHYALKPGGRVRVIVPDLARVARKYVAGESLRDIYSGEFFYHVDCPAERFTYWAREWEHTMLYDEPLLRRLMQDAGFIVCECEFNCSEVDCLRGLDRFESESLVVEGVK